MKKIPVYLMPGLAASATIFERIDLPKDTFEIHLLEWFVPEKLENLQEYAKRMAKNVKHILANFLVFLAQTILIKTLQMYL